MSYLAQIHDASSNYHQVMVDNATVLQWEEKYWLLLNKKKSYLSFPCLTNYEDTKIIYSTR